MTTPAETGTGLRAYLALTALISPLCPLILRRRLKRGKEDPARWSEKRGRASAPRPDGPLIWLHAVGLGEVMALRGLIAALHAARPDLSFLVTSTARSSGGVFADNLPPRTTHQFLPLDLAGPVTAFLDHWHPDLAVWSEQDLWPRLVHQTHARGIPLALVNARMDSAAHRKRARMRGMLRDTYARFAYLAAQDDATARHIRDLAPNVTITTLGSLKSGSAPLPDDPRERADLARHMGARKLWCAASTHGADEAVVLAAQAMRHRADPAALLIIVPRDPDRRESLASACAAYGLPYAMRSRGELPKPGDAVWIADSFGELGLWYRLCPVAVIGGSFGQVQGHNPWEAAQLDCAILHGPNTANFAADYTALAQAGATIPVRDAATLNAALDRPDLIEMATQARILQSNSAGSVARTSAALLDLLGDG